METKSKKLSGSAKEIDNVSYSEENEIVNLKGVFTAIRQKKDWFITLGKYRLTENMESLENCEKWVNEITWEKLVQVMLVIEDFKENVKQINK